MVVFQDRHYMFSVLLPIGCGMAGAFLIVCMAYLARNYNRESSLKVKQITVSHHPTLSDHITHYLKALLIIYQITHYFPELLNTFQITHYLSDYSCLPELLITYQSYSLLARIRGLPEVSPVVPHANYLPELLARLLNTYITCTN